MAEVHVTFIRSSSGPQFATDQRGTITREAFYAVGLIVYGMSQSELKPADVSTFPHTAEPFAISGTMVEIRVELASDDWMDTKAEYDAMADKILRKVENSVILGPPPFVWVTGGPFTGFADGSIPERYFDQK